MKLLHILVNGHSANLRDKVIHYLLDAGHFVYILRVVGEEDEILSRTDHNMKFISSVELHATTIDFEFCLGFEGRLSTLPLVKMRVLAEQNEAIFQLVQQTSYVTMLLTESRLPWSQACRMEQERLLSELCIDGFIALSRGSASGLLSNSGVNVLLDWHQAQKKMQFEAQALARLVDLHGLFNLRNQASCPGGNGVSQRVEAMGIGYASDLLLLALQLQFLLNARRPALYQIQLHRLGSSFKQAILLTGQETYNTLRPWLDAVLISQEENSFYNPHEAYSNLPAGGADISLGGEELRPDSLFGLSWDEAGRRATLALSRDIPFFTAVVEYIDDFVTAIATFKCNGCNFDALTALSARFFKRYYEENNRTECTYPSGTIVELFEKRVRSAPDHPAVLSEEGGISYRQLNQRANQLAHYLKRTYALSAGDLVGVMLSREAELVVTLIAVLKIGCAYLPLDKGGPPSHSNTILEDARPRLLISDAQFLTGSCSGDLVHLNLKHYYAHYATTPPESAENLEIDADPSSLAYVIYTSGTTGRPKGVAVENRSFLNIAHDIRQRITLTASDRFLAITTLSFDIAALEIFLPLMFGATVVLADQRKLQEENRFQHYLDTFAISLMQGTPSFWQQISQQYPKMPLSARVLCGGEALPTAVANWLARMTDGAWNVYGPTETTVWSMAYKLQVEQSRVTIGKPLSNTQCFVLDAKCTPLPPGVVGELYISGLGVARGYLGDQQLTDKSFLPNVFKSSRNPWFGQIMYKTGDRVRCLPCGNFEYLGRCDNQIKLRGHRIELGEIESIMQMYPGLQRAVVTLQPVGVDDPQQLFLAAYYQARAPIERQLLLDFLAALLPDYMLPNAYLFLEKLPLNANGKVDRNALPTVQFGAAGNYVPPITACQQDLCRIYQDILGAGDHRIGIMDDFFFLGGNSLSAIRLANRINRELKCDVKVKDIFSCKSIKNLAPLVEVGRGTFIYQDYLIESTAPESCFTPFPLSNIQQTYYFGRMKSFELSNVSTHIYSEFAFGYLDHQLLECSYNQLIARHHALRTIFENGEQRYLEAVPYYTIPYRKVQHESELIALREVFSHKVYSPERYPLFDIFITEYDEKYILHVSFDAIIIDMSSFKILFAEWIELYKNPETVFMPLEITYRDYQMQYERMRAGAIFERSLDYWQQKIDGYKLELNLPLAVPPSTIDNPHFRRLSAIVPTHVWQKIVSKCQQANVTPTVVILELYSRILCYWSGQDGLCLNLTLFNRLPLHPQVEAIIGDFTVLSLFNYQRCNTASMNEQLVKVHKELLSDMDNNLCDGVDVQRLLRQRRGLPSHAVITPVVLTSVLGMNDKANMFELPFNESYRGIDYAISQTSQVWLDHKAYETDEGFVAEWDYVEQLFDEQTIEAMHESYCRLIHWVAEHDWDCMAFPSPTLPSEQRLSIEGWNSTQAEFPPHTLHGLFDSYVDQPDVAGRTAVVETEGGHYNYGRLRDHVYSIGGALLSALPAGKGNVVAVLAEKGYLQVAATIGIMKSGGIYLPLHVAWPISRIDAILRQARCKAMLVSDSQYRYLQPALGQLAKWVKIIEIESPLRRPIPHPDVWPLVLPEDLAYIIFTSGSSGTPKGCQRSHKMSGK